MHVHACAGVYLSLKLKGVVYANNSVIQITEIGETDPDDLNEGLQCITYKMPCCRFSFRAGEWYMYTPERTIVPGPGTSVNFYRNRGYDDGTVNLNRPSDVMIPTGLFCCVVPDVLNVTQSVRATISELEKSLNCICYYSSLFSLISSYWCHCTNQRQCSHSSSRTEPLPHL